MTNVKSKQELVKMRSAGKIVSEILEKLSKCASPGVSTKKLDSIAAEIIAKRGAKSAFLGYYGFPANICTSINLEVVHGIPNEKRILTEGDIISIDVGVAVEGYCADAAVTVPVGYVNSRVRELIETTKFALKMGIEKARVGNRLFDISSAIQFQAECHGFSVVRDYTGHGIGTELQELPQIPNYGEAGKGLRLKQGMTLCMEPMVNIGSYEVDILNDGWTVVTKDKSLSAHFEHTVLITENEPEILTI